MHFVNAKGILSAKNGMNLYRGCQHGCIYCDSRSNCYNMNHDFEDVEIKENSIDLLDKALSSKRQKCMVGMGSMTDPYIPLENELKYTRRALEVIYNHGFGVTLITKSDMILRDIELLKKINQTTKCVVQMTLTTFDDNLCKIIEPNVCTSSRRCEVLKILHDNGIPTVVWLCPILPYINDTKENIDGILKYCADAKVKGIICFGMGLTLRDGNREYFYQKLDEHFPGLKKRYITEFGNSYNLPSPKNRELMTLFYQKCAENNIMCDVKNIFDYLNTFESKYRAEQISLF